MAQSLSVNLNKPDEITFQDRLNVINTLRPSLTRAMLKRQFLFYTALTDARILITTFIFSSNTGCKMLLSNLKIT